MRDYLIIAKENNLDNEISKRVDSETVKEKTNVGLEEVSNEVDNTGEGVETEENESILFYELNDYLKDYPIVYSETKLLKSMLERLCSSLMLSECDSVILAGDNGCGKTSLMYYYVEKVNSGILKECTVLEISDLNFPNTCGDIINELIITAECFVQKGIKNIIFFFDNLQDFPGCLWTNYDRIVTRVVNAFSEDICIKFVISVELDYLYASEEVAKRMLNISLLYTIGQEITPEKIISVLAPRIQEKMEYHGIETIEDKVLFMIYSMESASSNEDYLSCEVYLTYVDKIMANFSFKGKRSISYSDIKNYYLEREYKGEYFKKPIKSRKEIARHEAGHTLIALLLDKFIYFSSVTVIGIANRGASGLTSTFCNSNVGWQNKKNYFKYAAFYLAGRYAEGNMDVGAQTDIEKVNILVRNFILTSGIFDELGKEFFWDISEYDKLSNEKKKIVEDLTQKIIKKARKYAKKKLKEYKPFIKALSKKLSKEMFLSRDEVLELWSEYK